MEKYRRLFMKIYLDHNSNYDLGILGAEAELVLFEGSVKYNYAIMDIRFYLTHWLVYCNQLQISHIQ